MYSNLNGVNRLGAEILERFSISQKIKSIGYYADNLCELDGGQLFGESSYLIESIWYCSDPFEDNTFLSHFMPNTLSLYDIEYIGNVFKSIMESKLFGTSRWKSSQEEANLTSYSTIGEILDENGTEIINDIKIHEPDIVIERRFPDNARAQVCVRYFTGIHYSNNSWRNIYTKNAVNVKVKHALHQRRSSIYLTPYPLEDISSGPRLVPKALPTDYIFDFGALRTTHNKGGYYSRKCKFEEKYNFEVYYKNNCFVDDYENLWNLEMKTKAEEMIKNGTYTQ